MLVSRDMIKGLSPVAEGYKIFNPEFDADIWRQITGREE